METDQQKCGKILPTKDSQLLAQFGISKEVRIRLVKLKVYVYKRVKKLEPESVNAIKPESSLTKADSIHMHMPVQSSAETEEIPKQFKCHLYKYSGANRNHLRNHLKTHSDKIPFKCNLCSYIALGRNYFKYFNQHLQTTHRGEKSHICQFCIKVFMKNFHKNEHEKRCSKNPKHNDKKWIAQNKQHKCHLCNYASWYATNLRVHLRRHLGNEPFACSLCTYKSSSHSNVNRHIATHTREKPFKCLQCDYSAAAMSTLKNHIKRRHGNENEMKTFFCNLCPKKYHSKSDLYAHILRHTGETPFVCQFCKKGFILIGHKNQHEKACKHNPSQKDRNWVEDQKIFKCDSCPYSSFYKSSLNRHLKIHSGKKPFHCSQCSYRTTHSSYLKKHCTKRHVKLKQALQVS